MSRTVPLLRTLLFVVGIGGALGFGARTAFAGAPSGSTCTDPAAYGSCLGWYDCKKTCERYGFSGIEAHCMSGCCYCEVT